LVVGGVTLVGARAPSQEILQTYYIGVFDPLDQLPPALYRLTVRGQSSAISRARFASGWVPANVIDSLNTSIGYDEQGALTVTPKNADRALDAGRRLVMFGPEGFREAPKDHRLVIVMSSSPEDFFNAVGESLETIVNVQQEQFESAESQRILEELYRLRGELDELKRLQESVDATAEQEEEG
jgi:hypothetical protein